MRNKRLTFINFDETLYRPKRLVKNAIMIMLGSLKRKHCGLYL